MPDGYKYEQDNRPDERKRNQVMASERVRKLAVELEAAEAKVNEIMDRDGGLVQQVREARKLGVPTDTLAAITGFKSERIEGWL